VLRPYSGGTVAESQSAHLISISEIWMYLRQYSLRRLMMCNGSEFGFQFAPDMEGSYLVPDHVQSDEDCVVIKLRSPYKQDVLTPVSGRQASAGIEKHFTHCQLPHLMQLFHHPYHLMHNLRPFVEGPANQQSPPHIFPSGHNVVDRAEFNLRIIFGIFSVIGMLAGLRYRSSLYATCIRRLTRPKIQCKNSLRIAP
jgi:hypothetical protein